MVAKISDIPTHNTAPSGASKIEIENPTGPTSEYTTIAEMLAANAVAGNSFKYTFNTATSGDPGSGKLLFDNATFASATAMNISETDANSNAIATILATMDDGSTTRKAQVTIIKGSGNFCTFYITGTLTDNGTYDTFTITPIVMIGSFANNDTVTVTFDRMSDSDPVPFYRVSSDPQRGIPGMSRLGGGSVNSPQIGQVIWYTPFLLRYRTTFIGIDFATGGTLTASTTLFHGIYDWDTATSKPTTQRCSLSQLAATNTFYTPNWSSSVTLNPGYYAYAFLNNKTGLNSVSNFSGEPDWYCTNVSWNGATPNQAIRGTVYGSAAGKTTLPSPETVAPTMSADVTAVPGTIAAINVSSPVFALHRFSQA